MTRHSTLTNPNDLHYAKLRTFAGSPSLVTPDFVDQILTAADTNKIYRATSTNQGGLVSLEAASGGSGEGSADNWIAFEGSIQATSGRSYILMATSGSHWIKLPIAQVVGEWVELAVSPMSGGTLYIDTNEQTLWDISRGQGRKYPELIIDNPSYWRSAGLAGNSFPPYSTHAKIIWLGSHWHALTGGFFEDNTVPLGWGCTDSAASNYNPDAIYDDGTCSYS